MKTKLRMNPIMKKDLKVTSRTFRFYLTIFFFELIIGIIFLFALQTIQYSYYNTNVDIYRSTIYFFLAFGITELGMISLIMPSITSSAISGEKEHQTFDILLTTAIPLWKIIVGKVFSAVCHVMMFVVASVPFLSVSFILGGLPWRVLGGFFLLSIVYCIFSGSVGIFSSALCKKSKAAIIFSLFLSSVILGMSFLPLAGVAMLDKDPFLSLLLLLFNPVMLFVEYFAMAMSGGGAIEEITSSISGPLQGMPGGIFWILLSTACILALSVFFMWASTRKIDPLRGKKIEH